MGNNFIQKIFPAKLSYRDFIFIPLFFSFYIVLQVFEPATYLLESFKGRPVSLATYEGLDIGKRVYLFYRAIGFSVFLMILFTRITIMMKDYFLAKELSLINGISLAGFCLLVFQLIGADMSTSIHFIFSLLIILSAGFVIHQVKKREDRDFANVFVWTILISISVYFFGWQLFVFAWGKSFFSLPVIVVITGIPVYLLFTDKLVLNYRALRASQPLLFIPLLSFVSIEFFMIMNQRGIFLPPLIIFVTGFLIILAGCFFRYRNHREQHPHRLLRVTIFQNMLPVTLVGLAFMAYYTPIVLREIDWFEDANHLLPIQQWTSFGKIPFLDSFSSHALSDFGMGILYSVFNGINPMGVFVYQFLIGVLSIVIIYFFIYKTTGDGFLAIWSAIAYPYTEYLLPSYFNLVPLATLSFVMIYEKQSVKRYAFFFLSILFMIIWRIDLGSSTLFAGVVGFAILMFFVPTFRFEKNNFLKGLGVASIFIIILLILGLIHSGSHLFISLKDALAYMSSFQSYGIKDLSLIHDLKYYSLYFIFPAVILLILIYVVFSLSRGVYKNQQAVLLSMAIIFFCLFYFSNLQRGLVRHTLAEQWDSALISFAFFIFSSAFLIKFLDKNQFIRFFFYYIFTTLLIMNYSFTTPDLKKNNTYGLLTGQMKEHAGIYFSKEKIARFVEEPDNKSKYFEFSEWMKKNYSKKSTFLDFSNSPMLYYFSGKVVPNYFDQIPHTAHDEYLQHRFLDDLKNYEIPVVVFSNEPKGFWDNLDGIPNTLRHYRITEYIYRNYIPAYVINNRNIWIRKNLSIITNENELLTIPLIDTISNNPIFSDTTSISYKDSHIFISYHPKNQSLFKDKKLALKLEVNSETNGEVSLIYQTSGGDVNTNQKTTQKIYKGENTLSFNMTAAETEHGLKSLQIVLPEKSVLSLPSLKFITTDYYIDRQSDATASYYLKWIPYMWGAFDSQLTNINNSKLESILSGQNILKSNTESKFDFKPVADKESGNYILLQARVVSGIETDLALNFGDSFGKNGSFNLSLKNDTLFHDYLVRISSQYNWYKKSNSWISLYPAINDVEIRKAEILKGD